MTRFSVSASAAAVAAARCSRGVGELLELSCNFLLRQPVEAKQREQLRLVHVVDLDRPDQAAVHKHTQVLAEVRPGRHTRRVAAAFAFGCRFAVQAANDIVLRDADALGPFGLRFGDGGRNPSFP